MKRKAARCRAGAARFMLPAWGVRMDFVEHLLGLLGLAWAGAVLLSGIAVILEGAALKTKAEEPETLQLTEPPPDLAQRILLHVTSLTPVFLFVHAVYLTFATPSFLIAGIGAVLGVSLVGWLIGRGLAGLFPPFRKLARALHLPVAVIALLVTLYATMPTTVPFLGHVGELLTRLVA